MQTNKIIVGDAVDILRNMETGICDMCVTSPPYYGLRDYETPGQIGLETSPRSTSSALSRYSEKYIEFSRMTARSGSISATAMPQDQGRSLRLTQETGVATQLKLYLPVTKPKT